MGHLASAHRCSRKVMYMAGEVEDDEDDQDGELSDDGLDEFEGDEDDGVDIATLDPRERAARSLEIRRAIESRLEDRKMRHDLDYLEIDDDDDDLDIDD